MENISQSGEGIAIQSTVGSLFTSLNKYKKGKIHIYKVAYVDYENVSIDEDPLSPYFHKRNCFDHEKELRAAIQEISYTKENEIDSVKRPFRNGGIYVPVDIDVLIEEIYLSPTCPDWQKEAIQSVLGKYGLLNRTVHHSELNKLPGY